MKTLVMDIGGTHVKVLATDHRTVVELPSGSEMPPKKPQCELPRLVENMTLSRVAIRGLWSTAGRSRNSIYPRK